MLTQSFSISQNVPVTLIMFILKIIVTSREHKPFNLRLELPMSKFLHESEPEMLRQTVWDALSAGLTKTMLHESIRDVSSAGLTERML